MEESITFLLVAVMQIGKSVKETFFPDLFAEDWNGETPLYDGPLKRAIKILVTDLGFPMDKIYIVNGSSTSRHSNTYFCSFSNIQRFILCDSQLKKVNYIGNSAVWHGCNTEEVVGFVSHELSHWNKNHVVWSFNTDQLKGPAEHGVDDSCVHYSQELHSYLWSIWIQWWATSSGRDCHRHKVRPSTLKSAVETFQHSQGPLDGVWCWLVRYKYW